jgi:hypothetical protein
VCPFRFSNIGLKIRWVALILCTYIHARNVPSTTQVCGQSKGKVRKQDENREQRNVRLIGCRRPSESDIHMRLPAYHAVLVPVWLTSPGQLVQNARQQHVGSFPPEWPEKNAAGGALSVCHIKSTRQQQIGPAKGFNFHNCCCRFPRHCPLRACPNRCNVIQR